VLLLNGHTGKINALAFHPDSQTLVSGGNDQQLILWRTGTPWLRAAHLEPVLCVGVSSNGPSIAAGAGNLAYFRTLEQLQARCELEQLPRDPNFYQKRPSGRFHQGLPRFNDSRALVPVSPASVTSIVFFADTPLVAVAHGNRTQPCHTYLELLSGPNGTRSRTRAFSAGVIAACAVGKRRALAVCQGDGTLAFWDIVSDQFRDTPLRKVGAALAVSPDGKLCAVVIDYVIHLVDVDRAIPVRTLSGHKGRIDCLAFLPDGRTLASGSWDRTVRYWDTNTGHELLAYEWPVGRVSALAFSPDGMVGACAGDAGTICLWDLD
jgi:WD40 repeat protein